MTKQEKNKRISQAMEETQRLIDKEMGYREDLRKVDYLDGLNKHMEKLSVMLEA